jgi:hypothetical protein
VNGLKERWNPKFIIGFTDTETVMLDFDNTSFKDVKYWALRTMKWFNLEGFIILQSSENHYHVVFNREVSWSENMRIVAWVALLSNNPMIQRWFLMQCIKQGSTLRVSPKVGKPSPKIVFRYGKQDKQVREYLSYRRLAKNIFWNLNRGVVPMRVYDDIGCASKIDELA